jgi:hypothetical protein
MEKYFYFLLLIYVSSLNASCSSSGSDFVEKDDSIIVVPPVEVEVTNISTLAELREYAAKDDGNIKMAAGTYVVDDTSYFKNIVADRYNDTNDNIPDATYNVATLFHFSGSNNVFDLTGVKISVDTSIYPELDDFGKIIEVFMTGSNNQVKGLKFSNQGTGYSAPYPDRSSAIMLTIVGNENTFEKVDLFITGSFPYGYGFHLGKGGTTQGLSLHKHSSLLISGTGTKLLGCNVVTRAFGHGIVMQGAVDTRIEDCYVEGEMRNTNEMLAETSGPAFNLSFYSDYAPGTIQPNQMVALSEDGIRTYATGNFVSTKTRNVTVLNTTVKNMRGGFDLVAATGDRIISGCTAIGCQTQGFSGGSGIVISNSKGDAQYGPLLSFWYTSGKNGVVNLELINTESDFPPTRLAEINGTAHNISLKNYEGKARVNSLPIVFGESFWADTRGHRYPNENPDTHAGASNVTLKNETGMPIELNKLSVSNKISTSGTVVDKGASNTINYE